MSDHDLVRVLNRLADLLRQSGKNRQAEWFRLRLEVITRPTATTEDVEAIKKELAKTTRGMGSLNDLVLRPDADSGLDKTVANQQLGELAEELYQLTRY